MKLISFSVSNYRSITRAHKIKLHDLTILVGKNNEGKSNIIKAISLSMNIIKKYSYFPHRRPMGYYKYLDNGFDYVWQRDFPVSSQNNKKNHIHQMTHSNVLQNLKHLSYHKTLQVS